MGAQPWERGRLARIFFKKCVQAARTPDSFKQYLDRIYYQKVPLTWDRRRLACLGAARTPDSFEQY